MLQKTALPNAYFWSQWQPQYLLPANGYVLVSDAGNAVVDPVPLDERGFKQIEELGGVAKVFVTTPDHERESERFAKHFGAVIVREPRDHEEVLPGVTAIQLHDQKNQREFALDLSEHGAVIVGDAVIGEPAGALSMLSPSKDGDVPKAALGLRNILRANPHTLLLGHGQSIFGGAYDALYRLLYERAGAEIHRVNVDDLELIGGRDEHSSQPEVFRCLDAEVGFLIGARKLGYRVSVLEPGQRFCPMHSHACEEEMFFVLEGEPSVRMSSGTLRCRKGDFVALPVGDTGTHQLLNESDKPAKVLLLARTEGTEACYYPDSDKLLVEGERPIIKGRRSLLVQAGPDLDYFYGET
jgi:uncharacterized cupin superfamily protein